MSELTVDAWRPQFYGLAVISKHYVVSVIKTFSPFYHGGFEKNKKCLLVKFGTLLEISGNPSCYSRDKTYNSLKRF